MAAPDVRNALRVNGRLCWGPTDLSGTYPFGGTALGGVLGTALKIRSTSYVIRAEELGGRPVDAIALGEEYTLAVVLAGWDLDAVTTLALDSATGATTGRAVLQGRPGVDAKRAGALVSDRKGILYFSPDADQHPGVLFRNALPMPREDGSIGFNLAEELGTPMLFLAVPDEDGESVYVGLREDLAL